MAKLFKLICFAGIVGEIILRAPYDRQRRQIAKTDQRVSRTERTLLTGLFFGMGLLPLVYSLTPWLNFANFRLSPRA